MGPREPETPLTPRPGPSHGAREESAPGTLTHAPSDEEAIALFTAFWRSERARPGGSPAVERLDALVSGGTPSVRLITYARYRSFVTDRIGAREPNPAVVFGSLGALPADGTCWELHYDGHLRGGLDACVDAADGRIMIVWETPEG